MGDTIVSAKIVDGYDRLLNATTRSAPAVSVEGPTGADAVVRAPTE